MKKDIRQTKDITEIQKRIAVLEGRVSEDTVETQESTVDKSLEGKTGTDTTSSDT